MEIKKVNLDRTKLSSDYIERKQDFKGIVSQAKILKPIEWKSPWFYGAISLSSVAIASLINFELDSSYLASDTEQMTKESQHQNQHSTWESKITYIKSTDKKG